MDKEQLKGHISRPATWMSTGGLRPTQALTESWVSRAFLYRENEEIPLDKSGQPMFPLFQLCLEGLPFVPGIVKNTRFLTVFLSPELPIGVTPNGQNWLIREYGYDEPVLRKALHNPDSWFKPFDEFKYSFDARLGDIAFDGIYYPTDYTQDQALALLGTLVEKTGQFDFQDLNPNSFQRAYKHVLKQHDL